MCVFLFEIEILLLSYASLLPSRPIKFKEIHFPFFKLSLSTMLSFIFLLLLLLLVKMIRASPNNKNKKADSREIIWQKNREWAGWCLLVILMPGTKKRNGEWMNKKGERHRRYCTIKLNLRFAFSLLLASCDQASKTILN